MSRFQKVNFNDVIETLLCGVAASLQICSLFKSLRSHLEMNELTLTISSPSALNSLVA